MAAQQSNWGKLALGLYFNKPRRVGRFSPALAAHATENCSRSCEDVRSFGLDLRAKIKRKTFLGNALQNRRGEYLHLH